MWPPGSEAGRLAFLDFDGPSLCCRVHGQPHTSIQRNSKCWQRISSDARSTLNKSQQEPGAGLAGMPTCLRSSHQIGNNPSNAYKPPLMRAGLTGQQNEAIKDRGLSVQRLMVSSRSTSEATHAGTCPHLSSPIGAGGCVFGRCRCSRALVCRPS